MFSLFHSGQAKLILPLCQVGPLPDTIVLCATSFQRTQDLLYQTIFSTGVISCYILAFCSNNWRLIIGLNVHTGYVISSLSLWITFEFQGATGKLSVMLPLFGMWRNRLQMENLIQEDVHDAKTHTDILYILPSQPLYSICGSARISIKGGIGRWKEIFLACWFFFPHNST